MVRAIYSLDLAFKLIKNKDYLKGTIKIDEYVTHHRKLSEINDGFHDMHVSQQYFYRYKMRVS